MRVGRRRALFGLAVLVMLAFGSVLGVGLYVAAPRPAVLGLPQTIAERRALFAAAPEPKEFWEVAGAGHVDLEKLEGAVYWGKVLPFLTRYVQTGGP